MQYAHGLGIIHRDLKPENVFLASEPDGQVIPKLLDFGISKMVRRDSPPITLTGLILGTPSYMSPEQLRAEAVDARSDVFSVGILLYECLTGRNPFEATTGSVSRMTAALEIQPSRPVGIPEPLWAVIDRALAWVAPTPATRARESSPRRSTGARGRSPRRRERSRWRAARTPSEERSSSPPRAVSWLPAPLLARPWVWAGMFATAAFIMLVVWSSPANSGRSRDASRATPAARSVWGEELLNAWRGTFDRSRPLTLQVQPLPPIVERTVPPPPPPVEPGHFLASACASASRVHPSKGKLVLRDPGF